MKPISLTLIDVLNFNKEASTTTYLAELENKQTVIVKCIEASDEQAAHVEREIECLASRGSLVCYSYEELKEKKFRRKPAAILAEKKPLTRLYYLVFDLVPGVNLQNFSREKNFTPEQWLSMFYHITKGLLAFHEEGYAHRDIKPDNFMINPEGIHPIDFGYSIRKEYADEYIAAGKPAFLAPEASPFDDNTAPKNNQLSDLASLGYTFLYLLDCIELNRYFRSVPDFTTQIPSILKEQHKFSDAQAGQLLSLLQQLIHDEPDKRPGLSLICEQLSALCEGNTRLDWMQDRMANQTRLDTETSVIATITIEAKPLSELKKHGYSTKAQTSSQHKEEDEHIPTEKTTIALSRLSLFCTSEKATEPSISPIAPAQFQ